MNNALCAFLKAKGRKNRLKFPQACDTIILRHKFNNSNVKKRVFLPLVKMQALLSHAFLRGNEFVSQQTELCVFQCVASAAHFFIYKGEKTMSPSVSGTANCV